MQSGALVTAVQDVLMGCYELKEGLHVHGCTLQNVPKGQLLTSLASPYDSDGRF